MQARTAAVFILAFISYVSLNHAYPQSFYPINKIDRVIKNAENYLGIRYRNGGKNGYGIDCSGLVYQSFRKAGIKEIPRVSSGQAGWQKGKNIKTASRLQRGDLVFFRTNRKKRTINHVGIVTSIDKNEIVFIHATLSKGVTKSKLSGLWEDDFVKAKRLFATTGIHKNAATNKHSTKVSGRYPQASLRYLTARDLQELSKDERRLMKNEIYARHGYEFHKSRKVVAYFKTQTWYNEIPKVGKDGFYIFEHYFSKIEQVNVEFIKKYRRPFAHK